MELLNHDLTQIMYKYNFIMIFQNILLLVNKHNLQSPILGWEFTKVKHTFWT